MKSLRTERLDILFDMADKSSPSRVIHSKWCVNGMEGAVVFASWVSKNSRGTRVCAFFCKILA